MKLLLTSAGLTTPEIRQALVELAGKTAAELTVAFVSTAANVEEGDKRWLIKDLRALDDEGYRTIDIVDISALPAEICLKRLEAADILLFGGGNIAHLLYWMQRSGIANELPRLLESRVYMGISAGSIVAGSSLGLWPQELLQAKELGEDPGDKGLQLVDFVVDPHLGNDHFSQVTKARTENFARESGEAAYLLDDTSAVIVDGDAVTTIGQEHYFFEGSTV